MGEELSWQVVCGCSQGDGGDQWGIKLNEKREVQIESTEEQFKGGEDKVGKVVLEISTDLGHLDGIVN